MKFSTSIKTLLAASVAALAANSAMAADGTINFTGAITAASCAITGNNGTGTGGTPGSQVINVNMGTVSIDALRNAVGNPGNVATGTGINLSLDCGSSANELDFVSLRFDPLSGGTGLHPSDNRLLAIQGGAGAAQGVAIGLYRLGAGNTSTLINLANTTDVIEAALQDAGDEESPTKVANLQLMASYIPVGPIANVRAGQANGILPFTLTYR